jgi:glycosyltransferase involved in cell wall biosynthesis
MAQRKMISVVVPCYNEENTITDLYEILTNLFHNELSSYDYEILFSDDHSKDGTRTIIRALCAKDPHVKALFNMANFGFSRNIFSAFRHAKGDCAFLVFGDLQDPPELLPDFVRKWEEGNLVVLGQKEKSDEGRGISLMRSLYYRIISWLSDSPQLKECNGYGLYDRKFLDVMNEVEEIQPYLKAVIAEYAPDCVFLPYHHHKSGRGKSNFNFYRNYDFAMQGITTSTKKLMRMATLLGVIVGLFSVIYAISVIVRKLIYGAAFPLGLASIQVGVFLLGGLILFFIGILGEYVLSINTRTMRKPRVVIAESLNMDGKKDETR